MKTTIGLTDKQRKGAAGILSTVLADEYLLLVKTKNYHWNVTGPHFRDLHKLFDEQYEALSEVTDEVAERIRSIGEMTPATMTEWLKLSRLKETPGKHPAYMKMVEDLLHDHETLIGHLRKDLDTCADDFHDMGDSDYLTGLMEKHEKMAWMLRATLE